jgi:hypothetical protein
MAVCTILYLSILKMYISFFNLLPMYISFFNLLPLALDPDLQKVIESESNPELDQQP